MIDPLFLILNTLNLLIRRITRIFSLIFVNYFPETPPVEDNKPGSTGIKF